VPPEPSDDLADHLEFIVDPAAPVGNLIPRLAQLLRQLRDRTRLPAEVNGWQAATKENGRRK
jgi:hypothetical protein